MSINRLLNNFAFWQIVAWSVIGLLSYFGGLNPYSLGLVSCLAVIGCMSLLSLLLTQLLSRHSFAVRLVHTLLVLLATFIVISSWYYFDYFQHFYSYQILSMGQDLFSGLSALNLEAHKSAALLFVLLISLSLIPIWLIRPAPAVSKLTLLTLALISIISLGMTDRSHAHYRQNTSNWLHPANIHPVQAFFSANTIKGEISQSEQAAFRYFDRKKNLDAPTKEAKPPYNVIFILLESFRADLLGNESHATNDSLTPNFDALSQHGMVGERHFSNTTHTVSAELNLWCSVFDLMGETKLAYHIQTDFNFNCLPQVLKLAGYQNLYFHGNTGKFYNRNELLPKVGFNDLFFYKDEPQPPIEGVKVGWGVDDITMFKIMAMKLKTLSQEGHPFFAHLTTLSNHYPFKGQKLDPEFELPYPEVDSKNTLYQNYQNMIAYTDFALGQFWNDFIRSELAESTIVVITSDHGIWEFGGHDYSLAEKNERFFRAPLFIYHPDNKLPSTSSGLSSHVDVAPTLLPLLGMRQQSTMRGQNLLHQRAKENWVISNKGRETLLRKKQFSCFLNIDECVGRQQECKASLGEIHLFDTAQNYQMCVEFEGDLSHEHRIIAQQKGNSEYDMARHYRSYLDKTLLKK